MPTVQGKGSNKKENADKLFGLIEQLLVLFVMVCTTGEKFPNVNDNGFVNKAIPR